MQIQSRDPPLLSWWLYTITSVLDLLADYLDVTTFVTGEKQEAETTILESQLVENEEHEEHTRQEGRQTADTSFQGSEYVIKNEEPERYINEVGG